MSEKKHINASTIARIAGNLLSGVACPDEHGRVMMSDELRNVAISEAVRLARDIAAQVERTEPKEVETR